MAAQPPQNGDVDQDVPTIYLEVPRKRYAYAHFVLLPALVHAGLHIDVLASEQPLTGLHAPGALAASASALVGAAPAQPGAWERDTRQPPGAGPVYIRVTAPEARLLQEAARLRVPLPLCALTLRALDEARNRVTRKPEEPELGIPAIVDAEALDPYEYIIAPYPTPAQPLPEVTLGALREVARARGVDASTPEAAAALLFGARGSDGVRVLSDVNSLKMLQSIVSAPSAAEPGQGGAGLSLPRLVLHGQLVRAFAGHSYAAREVVMAAASASVRDYRNYGVAAVLKPLAGLCGFCRGAGGGSGSGASGTRSGARSGSGGAPLVLLSPVHSLPEAPPGAGGKGGAPAPLSPAAALEYSVSGRDPRLRRAGGEPPHVRISEYVRGYLGERVALFFGFTEYLQSTLALLAGCGTALYIWQNAARTVEVAALPAYAFLSAVWAVLALELWKRRQSTLVTRFGMHTAPAVQALRPQYVEAAHTARVRSPEDGSWVHVASPRSQSLRLGFSVGVTVLGLAVALAVIIGIFALRLELLQRFGGSGDAASALINSAWIGIGNALWTYIAAALTDLETQPTESAHAKSQIFKTSLFRIVNTYFSLFYIAAGIGQFIAVGGRTDNCSVGGQTCLDNLYEQLGIQLAVNWASLSVFFHAVPALLPRLSRWLHTKEEADAEARGAASIAEGVARVRNHEANTVAPAALYYRIRAEASAPVFDEGNFFMIQLLNVGYVMLFSPAFSLAPLIAMALNALSTVLDLDLALRRSARPLPESATDTGAWLLMFELMACLCVLTNSLVISVPTTAPIFTASFGSWNTIASRMGWFIAAETTLFAFKYMCVRRLQGRALAKGNAGWRTRCSCGALPCSHPSSSAHLLSRTQYDVPAPHPLPLPLQRERLRAQRDCQGHAAGRAQ